MGAIAAIPSAMPPSPAPLGAAAEALRETPEQTAKWDREEAEGQRLFPEATEKSWAAVGTFLNGKQDERALGKLCIQVMNNFAQLRGNSMYGARRQQRFARLLEFALASKRGRGSPSAVTDAMLFPLYDDAAATYPPRKKGDISKAACKAVVDRLGTLGIDCSRLTSESVRKRLQSRRAFEAS